MRELLIIGLFIGSVVHAQTGEEDLEIVWKNNIQAIIDLDEPRIMDLTNFPLEGNWNYIIGENVDATIEIFQSNMGVLFSEDLRSELASQDPTYLTKGEDEIRYMYMELTVVDEMELESMKIYRFRKINDIWKLVSIEIAG